MEEDKEEDEDPLEAEERMRELLTVRIGSCAEALLEEEGRTGNSSSTS